jgi:chromatin assembly factor 1 subunit B
MKVETPQILWHDTHNMSAKDNGKSFPILSCHLVTTPTTSILATAGGCEINLWRVVPLQQPSSNDTSNDTSILIKPTTHHQEDEGHTRIEHLLTLSRGTNERTINCVRFSPDTKHLAAVGDGGLVVVWTLPPHTSWDSLTEERDLSFKIIYNQSDDVMDLSWGDVKRFTVCSLDHTVAVFESDGGEEWKAVFRSSKDHTHYVQGVAMDPKGVYMASQGSDRTVKVYARKAKEEEDLLKKFELGKAKTIKFLGVGEEEKREKKHLFADEVTLGSFFRRLAFTTDGAFLVVPAALWHGDSEPVENGPSSPKGVDKLNEASFGTYLFARHCFEKPYKVLAGLDKVRFLAACQVRSFYDLCLTFSLCCHSSHLWLYVQIHFSSNYLQMNVTPANCPIDPSLLSLPLTQF